LISSVLLPLACELPEKYRDHLPGIHAAVRCTPVRGLAGLANSIGYLAIGRSQLIFATRRGLRFRTFHMPLDNISKADIRSGIMMDQLSILVGQEQVAFDLFKTRKAPCMPEITPSPHHA
jgi:hypothetical protein